MAAHPRKREYISILALRPEVTPPPSEVAETVDEAAASSAAAAATGDSSNIDDAILYQTVRKAIEDALMNVFWTILLLGCALVLLWLGGVAAIGVINGSVLIVPVAVALFGLAAAAVAVALEIPIPVVGSG